MKIKILTNQTQNSYDWTYKLLDSVPFEVWEETPDVIESNVSWQVGHLILSTYFHSISVISGHQRDVLETIPMKRYAVLYTNADPKKSIGTAEPKELQGQLMFIQNKSIKIISSLTDDDLNNDLEPSRTPHPIAGTKFEAIDWNIKHTMWHCGQLGMLKRIVHERYDFGFKYSN